MNAIHGGRGMEKPMFVQIMREQKDRLYFFQYHGIAWPWAKVTKVGEMCYW